MSAPENPAQPRADRPAHIWQGARGRWCASCQTGCRSGAQCVCCDVWSRKVAQAIADGIQAAVEGQEAFLRTIEKGPDNG